MVAMFRRMLEDDRKRAGWSVGQAAWRLGVSVREYRKIEAGESWPNWETFHRICVLFGWPETFARSGEGGSQ
jgi:DNA-binding XRE family transcriptional regulator